MKRGVFNFGLVGLVVGLLYPAAYASEISSETATMAAQAWIDEGSSLGKLTGARAGSAVTFTNDVHSERLHVVTLAGGGYVVTSADDLVTPVLAFSPSGTILVPDENNPLWSLLKGDISARESAAGIVRVTNADLKTQIRATALAATASVSAPAPTPSQQRWASLLSQYAASTATVAVTGIRTTFANRSSVSSLSDLRVDALVKSRWGQDINSIYSNYGDPCYNYYVTNRYVSGCAATALAQMIRFHRYPSASVDRHSKTCAVNGVQKSFQMIGGVYDYDKMKLVPEDCPSVSWYDGGATEAERQEIGKLTYDCGVAMQMNWTSQGSSAGGAAANQPLTNIFRYANAKTTTYESGLTDAAYLKKVIYSNLDGGYPVLLSIDGSSGGHPVVADGYGYAGEVLYTHLNMGWSGVEDVWYALPEVTTSQFAFNIIKGVVYNIFPTNRGEIVSGRVTDSFGYAVEGASVSIAHNGVLKGSATTSSSGIYAFVVDSGKSYVVTASYENASAVASATTLTSVDSYVTLNVGSYSTDGKAVTCGNVWGCDLVLSDVAPVAIPVLSPEACSFDPSTNVTITCATEGATIRYTTDGSDPTVSSTVYTVAIVLNDTTTIKARGYKSGMTPSAVAAQTYTYAGTSLAAALDTPDLAWTTSEGDPWIFETSDTDDGVDAAQSSLSITWNDSSWIQTTITGPATVTFRYRTLFPESVFSASVDNEVKWSLSDGADPAGGGSWYIDSNWYSSPSIDIPSGQHVFKLNFECTDMFSGFTGVWVDQVQVEYAPTTTSGTDVPVPYSWLDTYYPGTGKTGTVYEEQGISDTDGDGFPAWQEYAANSDPTNAASRLTCAIEIGADGKPVLSVVPAAARDGFPRI